jgi:hypothetical protein
MLLTVTIERIVCSTCDQVLPEEVAALTGADRPPCPACGGTARRVEMTLMAKSTAHVSLSMKGRAAGGGPPFLRAVQNRLEWFRQLGRWHLVNRSVNRREDRYDEVIYDRETGAVVHEVHEPLHEHHGHGSARPRP